MKKLAKSSISNMSALTPLQEGILFHYLKNPASEVYFEQLSLEISGAIHVELFEKAWNHIAAANEMLRTLFRWKKMEKPIQVVLKEHHIQPVYHDLSTISANEQETRLQTIRSEDRKKKFDLQDVPFRVTLCKLHQEKYEMIISHHHILYDGWSTGIILKEFLQVYNGLSRDNPVPMSTKTRFEKFVKWLQNQDQKRQEKFWKDYLKGVETPTTLSIKTKREEDIFHPGKITITLEEEKTSRLQEFLRAHKISIAAFLYSSWGLLLQKYNNSSDVILGTTVSGRSAKIENIENIVGLFINTVPLRLETGSGEKIIDVLQRINEMLQNRAAYESTPLVKIREYSGLNLPVQEDLFDTIVVIENYPLDKHVMQQDKPGELSITSYSIFEMTNYDLTLSIILSAEIEVSFIYNRALFTGDAIERLAHHFSSILEDIPGIPGKRPHEIEILSQEEKKQLLLDFNDTAAEYPEDKTIHQLFAEQVHRTPHHTALVGVRQTHEKPERNRHMSYLSHLSYLSYKELNEKSNQLAYLLQSKGVGPDTIVGIMVERSLETLIGIFAILKAGGAYLPIKRGYPEERIEFMLKDSNAKILLTKEEITELFSPEAFNICPQGTSCHLHLPPHWLTSSTPPGPRVNPKVSWWRTVLWLTSCWPCSIITLLQGPTPIF